MAVPPTPEKTETQLAGALNVTLSLPGEWIKMHSIQRRLSHMKTEPHAWFAEFG
jgi:hypothetical protein